MLYYDNSLSSAQAPHWVQKSIDGGFAPTKNEDTILINEAIGDALFITAEKKGYFWFVLFFPSQFLVRHIFSESGLFDLNDRAADAAYQTCQASL